MVQNLDTLHNARYFYSRNEAPSKIKQPLNDHMQTYSGTIYNTCDIVYYKRINLNWKIPESVLERDGQQVLVKQVKLN